MGAEDFAYYLEKVPGTFYRLGIRNEAAGITADIHNDHFTIDETSMKAGAAMQAYLDWEFGLVEQLRRDGTHHFQVI